MFKDDLGHLGLTTKSIEQVLLSERPEFKGQNRNDKIEWQVKIPPIVPVFYRFVMEEERIPKQSELWDKYSMQDLTKYTQEDILAIETRVRSTYPSLVRDIHFYCTLKESGLFDEVIYNQEVDLRNDADIVVKKYGIYFGIALYLKSNRSSLGRDKKTQRHRRLSELTYIEVPFTLQGSREVNRINLYGDDELQYILARIRYYKLLSLIGRVAEPG